MRFHNRDMPLIWAFLDRESRCYNWDNPRYSEEYRPWRRILWMAQKMYQITRKLAKVRGADHVTIESLTNLGQVDSSITVTPDKFKAGIDIMMNLGNSPNNGLGFAKVKRY